MYRLFYRLVGQPGWADTHIALSPWTGTRQLTITMRPHTLRGDAYEFAVQASNIAGTSALSGSAKTYVAAVLVQVRPGRAGQVAHVRGVEAGRHP
jgi:hypothetical protein